MANYYVDATLGDDGNPGTQIQPWRTVSKVNSMSFSTGDNIYFKRGEVWREALVVPSSGVNGGVITFGAYGNGDKPKITGADIEADWTGPDENGVWQINDSIWKHQILLEDGEKLCRLLSSDPADLSPGQFGGDSNHIYYKPTSGTPDDHVLELGIRQYPLYISGKSYIKVENLRFEAGNYLSDDPYKLRAVAVLQNCNSCEISNCEVHFGEFFGISLNGATNCDIENTEVTYIGRRGINIGADCSDITVASCHVHHIGKKDTIHSGGIAEGDKEGISISAFSSDGSQEPYNITIEHNRIYSIGSDYAQRSTNCKGICTSQGGADSGNITNVTIRYNKIYNCDGKGISLEGVSGDYEIYYNIVFNNGIGEQDSGTYPWGGLILGTATGTADVKIFNNVFWKNDGGPGTGIKTNVRISVGSGSTLTLSFKNNIVGLFQDASGYDLYFASSGTLNLDSDYNLFYEDSDSKNCIYWNGNTYDFAHIIGNQSGYWSYDHSQDSHSLCQNPLFMDVDNHDFHLQFSSPCIDAGTDVGLGRDFDYNPVPWGAGVDIGAFELVRRTTMLLLSCSSLDCRSGGWLDLSRKGNHGTPYGGARPYMIAPGVMGFKLDGDDSTYLDCGEDESLKISSQITMGGWLLVQEEHPGRHVITKRRPGYNEGDYDLKVGYFCLYVDNLGYPDGYKNLSFTPIYHKWVYEIAVYDGQYMKVYLNGDEVANSDIGSHTIDTRNSKLFIGSNALHTYKHPLKGVVAEIVIASEAWSPDKVRENMYRSPVYRMLRGLPHSMIYTKVPWKQTQGGIYAL
ncbi:MAG: hypothetical protein DRI61_11565 [Chloroflexi bacterium]|nr:MAG: hypothetical protein DRI61_11565 [Chloroflexota bacterium]